MKTIEHRFTNVKTASNGKKYIEKSVRVIEELNMEIGDVLDRGVYTFTIEGFGDTYECYLGEGESANFRRVYGVEARKPE